VNYQVVIIGAGPAGLFAAMHLAEEGVLPLLLIEQGRAERALSTPALRYPVRLGWSWSLQ